ncbi:MAG: ribokinase [Frankiales bacterium]|nr:ribokinase [Frankiales bacterium]
MPAPASVLVIGSVNQDITVRVPRFPGPGETLLGRGVAYALGGKGANQAVASARTGTPTTLLATVGDDPPGRQLRHWLAERGVDVSLVRAGRLPSGTAHILVDDSGENQIVVVSGANAGTDAQWVDAAADAVASAAVVVVQGEIPVPAIERALTLGARTILNLAPVVSVAPESLAHVDVLVVNEAEAGQLLGRTVSGDPWAAVDALSAIGGAAVLTLGAGGAVWAGDGRGHAAAPEVVPVDTTGAGDAFVGVLAAALARGRTLGQAVHDGVRAASRSVLLPGAAMSYPAFDLA